MESERGRSPLVGGTAEMQSYELHDGPRIVRFQGTHLARKTSDDGDRLRWLELDIYRTRAGKYIVHQVGKTVVYHLTDSD
jgi:EXLDI family protein